MLGPEGKILAQQFWCPQTVRGCLKTYRKAISPPFSFFLSLSPSWIQPVCKMGYTEEWLWVGPHRLNTFQMILNTRVFPFSGIHTLLTWHFNKKQNKIRTKQGLNSCIYNFIYCLIIVLTESYTKVIDEYIEMCPLLLLTSDNQNICQK